VTQTLLEALRDRRKPLSTHYGAIVGLQLEPQPEPQPQATPSPTLTPNRNP